MRKKIVTLLIAAMALSACCDGKKQTEQKENTMSFLDLVKKRKSIRSYLDKEVEQEKLDYVMECARLAPSASNRQPWHYYIVKSEDAKSYIHEVYPAEWIKNAPLFIVACADKESSWKRSYDGKDYADVDIAIAFEHICLAAAEQELGTCWIGHFDPAVIRTSLQIPENLEPIALTPLGYPNLEKATRATTRKAMEEIIEIR